MFRVPKGTEMTTKLLAKYISKHKAEVSSRMQKLQDAYENKYEINDYQKNPKKPNYKPDVRISINHAKYIVDTFNGFFTGVPIKVTVKGGNEESKKIIEFVDKINTMNYVDNRNREIAKFADIHGAGHEIYYSDKQGEIGIMQVSPIESFFLYDDSILCRPLYFVRYYKDAENVERGSFSDDKVVQKFYRKGDYYFDGKAEPHYFDGVPATEFPENAERHGLFESELSAMNEYNKALSEKANDVDYYADAYLKILGPELTEKDIKDIRDDRVFNYAGDSNAFPVVDFLQKPNADSTQENLLDRLKNDIFQISMVANISDETFGNTSGEALKYKLKTMSDLAKTKAGLFREALARRYKVIFSHPTAVEYGVEPDDWMKLQFKFTENFPANIANEASTVSLLSGEVSERTKLSLLSSIEDVDAEIEAMKKEREEAERDTLAQLMFKNEDISNGEEKDEEQS